MAHTQFPISNIEQGIVKPIVIQVLETIKKDIFFDRDAQVLLLDHTGSTMEVGSTLTNSNMNDLRLESSDKIIAISNERPIDNIVLAAGVDADDLTTIWEDTALDARIRPTRHRTEMLVQLTYKAESRQSVVNWLHAYYNRLARGVSFTNADVAYEISIPSAAIAVLQELWKAREARHGIGQDFLSYLSSNSVSISNIKTNKLGNGATWIFRELLTGLKVAVTTEMPEPSRLPSGSYEATIEVSFFFDKPTTIIMDYPIFIHNGYINPNFFDSKLNRNLDTRKSKRTTSGRLSNLLHLHDTSDTDIYATDGLIIPAFDDMSLNHSGANIAPIVQMQLGISETDTRLLLDLSTLQIESGMELHPELLQYIYSVGNDIFIEGSAAICISVYRDGIRINPKRYILDDNHQVRSTYDLNLQGRYHLGIAVNKRLAFMSTTTIGKLAKYGDLANSLMRLLHPNIDPDILVDYSHPEPVLGVDSTSVSTTALIKAIEALPSTPAGIKGKWFLINTVILSAS